MATETSNTNKEYKEERFEFALYVNENLICKRNFKINNFIEGSMDTLNFKETFDGIVRSIDNDLKSKSRVYTWYYFNEDDILNEFKDPLIDPWECTFKFEITDNHKLVMSRIWDGYAYPKAIRNNVDITNKNVKVTTQDDKTYVYDKETYFKTNADRLSAELYVLRAMIMDKPDLLQQITRKICEVCSPRENLYKSIGDYTVSEIYKTDKEVVLPNGESRLLDNTPSKKYFYSVNLTNNKYISDWAKAVSKKTQKYFETLY